jgi:hypothetical protein
MTNTLVIGVGGTGVKTLIHVKKQLQDARLTGDLPKNVQILGIDTREIPEKSDGIGAWESAQARRNMKDYGGEATIDRDTEYFWLGGNLVTPVCGDQVTAIYKNDLKHPSSTWFNQNFFCNNPQKNTLLVVKDGAGMYRQIGRRALFYNLQYGESSPLYKTLKTKLTAFPAGGTVNVIVCGSLAGGTGASIFLDIAHLIRSIAATIPQSVDIYAMLVLPDAFQWNPPVIVKEEWRARGMAALRELTRFLTVHSDDLGFRMRYVSDGNQVLDSRTSGALFSLVYLLEERATLPNSTVTPNPLEVRIEYGIAPTMATWIAGLCDDTIAAEVQAWKANRAAVIGESDFQGLVPAYCGSFGTFSLVLPVAAIIEVWTARLAHEVIDLMVPLDDNKKFNENGVGGQDSGLPGKYAVKENWKKNPSMVARDAGNLAERYSDETHPTLVGEIRNRKVAEWQSVFLDENTTEQFKTFQDMEEKKLYYYNKEKKWPASPIDNKAMVQLIPKSAKDGSAEKAADALDQACSTRYTKEETNWKSALTTIQTYQVTAYQDDFRAFVSQVLNGDPLIEDNAANAIKRRGGKPGWLLSYVSKQVEDLETSLSLLQQASDEANLKIKGLEKEWKIGVKGEGSKLKDMQKDDGKQKDYLETRQDWLENKRWYALCAAEIKIVKNMLHYTRYFKNQLKLYVETLNNQKNSIATFLDNTCDVINNQRKSGQALNRVRELVDDKEWENNQYNKFTHPDTNGPSAAKKVLSLIKWAIREVEDNEEPVPDLVLEVGGFELDDRGALATNVIKKEDEEKRSKKFLTENAFRLMETCRQQFNSVWDELTVLSYYKYKFDSQDSQHTPEAFADFLLSKCNALLSPGEAAGGVPIWMAYMLVPRGTQDDPWLQVALGQLRKVTTAARDFSGVLQHQDNTTITYLAQSDIIDIPTLDAYTQGAFHYLNIPEDPQGVHHGRTLLHVFAAEQNATHFDKIRADLSRYLVSSRVSMVLEEEETLDNFLLALALNLVRKDEISLGGGATGNVYKVVLKTHEKNFGIWEDVEQNWLLNNPQEYKKVEVDFLVAAETFCLRSLDFSNPRQAMLTMHILLETFLTQQIQEKIKEEFLPKWTNQQGLAVGIQAASEPNGSDSKQDHLVDAAKKELYHSLVGTIKARIIVLGKIPTDEALANKTLKNEVEFLEILLTKINDFLK